MNPTAEQDDSDPISVPVGEAAPAGQWIGVRKGQIVAPDTYYDREGYLRDARDDSYVAWHWGPLHCSRKGMTPAIMVTDPETGARWCPECWPVRQKFYRQQQERTELEKLFGTKDLGKIQSELYEKNL